MNDTFNRKIRITDWILNILLAGMVSLILAIIYWGLWPYDIIEWKIDHYQTQKQVYTVGEALTYRTAFCKKGDWVAQQIRRLEDGVVYLFPDLTSSTQEGCRDFISTTTIVPNVPSGDYYFEIEFIYHVNPVRDIRYTMRSNRFTILNEN